MSVKLKYACFFIFIFAAGNLLSQKPQVVLQTGHAGPALGGCFSPKGDFFISWSEGGQILKWDMGSGLHYAPLKGVKSLVTRNIIFYNDSQFYIIGNKELLQAGNVFNDSVETIDEFGISMRRAVYCEVSGEPVIVCVPDYSEEAKVLFYYASETKGKRFKLNRKLESFFAKEPKQIFQDPFRECLYFTLENGDIIRYSLHTGTSGLFYHSDSGEVVKMAITKDYIIMGVKDAESWNPYPQLLILDKDGNADQVSKWMKEKKLEAVFYHAGLNSFITFNLTGDQYDVFGKEIKFYDLGKLDLGHLAKPPVQVKLPYKPGLLSNYIPVISANQHLMMFLLPEGGMDLYWLDDLSLVRQYRPAASPVYTFRFDEKNARLYSYSLLQRTFGFSEMSSGNFIRKYIGFPSVTDLQFDQDGNAYTAGESLRHVHRIQLDGKHDSMPNPFDMMHGYFINDKYQCIFGKSRLKNGGLLWIDKQTFEVKRKFKYNIQSFSGFSGQSPDFNTGWAGDWHKMETKAWDLRTGKQIYSGNLDKILNGKYGVARPDISFADSGRLILIPTKQYNLDGGGYKYWLAVVQNRKKYPVQKAFQTEIELNRYFPGRHSDEIAILPKKNSGISRIYLLNLKQFTLDSLDLNCPEIGKIQWINGGKHLLVKSEPGNMVRAESTGALYFFETGKPEPVFRYSIQKNGFCAVEPDGTLLSTKGSSAGLAYEVKNGDGFSLLPGRELEPLYNKPQQILRDYGSHDSVQILAYEAAYQKRLKTAQISVANTDNNRPVLKTHLPREFKIVQDSIFYIPVEWIGSDTIIKILTEHNGVPLYGPGGVRPDFQNTKGYQRVKLILVPGLNQISITVSDIKGRKSYAENFEIFYKKEQVIPKTYFIGIGVSKYRDTAMNLVFAAKDIRDLAAVFGAEKDAIIDTFINENALKKNIENVRNRLKSLHPWDKVIVSYSGHGLLSKQLDLFLASHEMEFENPENKGFGFDYLLGLLDSTPALQKLLLLDACHSGELDKDGVIAVNTGKGNGSKGAQTISLKTGTKVDAFEFMKSRFEDAAGGNGTVIISAAGGKEFALETPWLQNGVFTFCLLKCLREKAGDVDGDGRVSVEELKNYLLKTVPEMTDKRQKPTMRKENMQNNWWVR